MHQILEGFYWFMGVSLAFTVWALGLAALCLLSDKAQEIFGRGK